MPEKHSFLRNFNKYNQYFTGQSSLGRFWSSKALVEADKENGVRMVIRLSCNICQDSVS